ncbi:hypothetical protein FRC07_003680 [Ceratobasidium sp. 392]|nr:hypothetical protein FRC07_003680 [Ceratobasidium sp. 392]
MARTGKGTTKVSRAPPAHPSFIDMIIECIAAYPEEARSGVSRPMIKKFLEEQYKIDITPSHITNINRAIARGAETNVFSLPKGPSGKVKLASKKATEAKENHAPTTVKKASATATKKPTTTTKRAAASKATTTKKAPLTASKPKAKTATTTKAAAPKAKSATVSKSSTTKSSTKPATKAATAKSTTKAAPAKKPAATKKAPVAKKTPTAKKAVSSTSTAAKAKASGATKGRTTRTAKAATTSGSRATTKRGAMTFGKPGTEGARVQDVESVGKILDTFKSFGHREIDTARVYTKGTSEELLGEVEWQKRGLVVETKLYPSGPIKHTPEGIREHLDKSLAALKTDKVELFYLHAPDRSTPFEVTFKAVNDLHEEGKFDKLGISNYMAWEVAEVVGLCRANGWIQPTVYQGIYNAVHRAVEPELLPCLRKFNIAFYLASYTLSYVCYMREANNWISQKYNPLCGGWLTGRFKTIADSAEPGSRFDSNRTDSQTKNYRARYWREEYFRALEIVDKAAQAHQLTIAECALRWVNHHSSLKPEYNDAVIIGASSQHHIESNLVDLEKGPLPTPVVEALDQAWEVVAPSSVL